MSNQSEPYNSARHVRRKQMDQRRMAYRRAIEERAERRRLEAQLADWSLQG